MKYNLILERFKKIGRYHILLAVVAQIAMIESFYIIVSLAAEQKPPVIICNNNTHNITSIIEDYCNDKTNCQIDYTNSVNNWALRHELYCDRAIYFKYITSSIFLFAILSVMTMSIVADRYGRRKTFIIETIGATIGLILIYNDFSIYFIIFGVVILESCNHIFLTSLLYLYEYFPQKQYVYLLALQNISYGVIGLTLNIYADQMKETKSLLLILIALAVFIVIYGIVILTESPDWLISYYKRDDYNYEYIEQLKDNYAFITKFNNPTYKKSEIDNILYDYDHEVRAATSMNRSLFKPNKIQNNSSIPKSNSKSSLNNQSEINNSLIVRNQSFMDFVKENLKNSKFRKHLALAMYLWIVNQLVFYTSVTNLETMNQYISHSTELFFISHILSNICVGLFTNYFGILNAIKRFALVAALVLMILIFVNDLDNVIGRTSFFLFNFFGTFVGENIYLFIPQLFEPQIRSTAASYSKIPAKILLIFSPFLIVNSITVLYSIFAVLLGFCPLVIYLLL